MKNIKTVLMIALVLVVVGVVGSIVSFNFGDTSTSSKEQVIDPEGITNIKINTNNDKVNVLPTKDSEIRVELAGNHINKNWLKINVNGETVSIQTVDQKKLFIINFFVESRTLTTYLPEQLYESLKVDIDNGSFHASHLTINNIEIETDNGRMEMEDMIASNTDIRSSNGKVHLDHVEGMITVKAVNGSISLVASQLDRSIQLESTNGKINIETETEPTNVTFDVKTTNGKATLFGSKNWDNVIGNGDHVIKLTTKNGSINVN
jgi:DUF4097 and DUF4098 domain-containing protein YvlB